jgi:hypothetical protein
MIEKFKKPKKILDQEPLPPFEQFKDLLFPVEDRIEDEEENKATIEQYNQGEQR